MVPVGVTWEEDNATVNGGPLLNGGLWRDTVVMVSLVYALVQTGRSVKLVEIDRLRFDDNAFEEWRGVAERSIAPINKTRPQSIRRKTA